MTREDTSLAVQRLLAALATIARRASGAPNDDAEAAGREFTIIMNTATDALRRYERDTQPS